jgi:hypothetical protein
MVLVLAASYFDATVSVYSHPKGSIYPEAIHDASTCSMARAYRFCCDYRLLGPVKKKLTSPRKNLVAAKRLTLVELQKVVPVGGRVYMTALEAALTKLTEVMSQSVVNSEQVILRVDPTNAL